MINKQWIPFIHLQIHWVALMKPLPVISRNADTLITTQAENYRSYSLDSLGRFLVGECSDAVLIPSP